MNHEKIFNRPNGSKVKITASIWIDMSGMFYNIGVYNLPARKRKWESVGSNDDYSWRKLDAKGRREYRLNEYLQFVNKEEILEAKTELWKLLKPTL